MASTRPVPALDRLSLRHARPRPRRALRRDPRRFGQRGIVCATAVAVPASSLSDDLRLFAATFAAGFLFVSVLIA